MIKDYLSENFNESDKDYGKIMSRENTLIKDLFFDVQNERKKYF